MQKDNDIQKGLYVLGIILCSLYAVAAIYMNFGSLVNTSMGEQGDVYLFISPLAGFYYSITSVVVLTVPFLMLCYFAFRRNWKMTKRSLLILFISELTLFFIYNITTGFADFAV